jgi:2-succinyl-5-enolpyruvyl-6-hydroxy-3-cyclohexene-1-carboxylate synthase
VNHSAYARLKVAQFDLGAMTSDRSTPFQNPNTLWAFVLAETLHHLGLTTAIICPGSRSAPLAVAFAEHPQIEAIPALDERSASFFALGIAQKSRLPVALVCTSGTAGANFYPAIIEAKMSRIPLLVFTADRPPELQYAHAGQAIDQVKLYGNYPNEYFQLGTPLATVEQLQYLRQTLIQAWRRALFPVPGVVHLNLPFRDPLAPVTQGDLSDRIQEIDWETFFAEVDKITLPPPVSTYPLLTAWENELQGIIIAGVDQATNPWGYCRAIARLSQSLGWVVLAEALSPVRNYAGLNPALVNTYDFILRDRDRANSLKPKMVIQIGELPTSKVLRTWLQEANPQRWVLSPHYENLDPLHGRTTHLPYAVEQLVFSNPNPTTTIAESTYSQQWHQAQQDIQGKINATMTETDTLHESKIPWLLSQVLPPSTPIFIANSMPVRDAEYFWMPRNSGIRPYFNRGANGIDGTLSTALGVAHKSQSSVLLTGDLAFLHDTNGLLLQRYLQGHLTIILINNNGGGIFERLPIAKFEPPFEEFFAMPQQVNFADIATTYRLEYHDIKAWAHLEKLLKTLPSQGIRLLEIPTNRKADTTWLENIVKSI